MMCSACIIQTWVPTTYLLVVKLILSDMQSINYKTKNLEVCFLLMVNTSTLAEKLRLKERARREPKFDHITHLIYILKLTVDQNSVIQFFA